MQKRQFTLLISLFVLLFISCEDKEDNPLVSHISFPALFVVNGLGESLSVIELETEQVFNDTVLTGEAPAEIEYYGGYLYLVNSGDNILQKVDIYSLSTSQVSLGDYKNPTHFEIVEGNTLVISNYVAGTVQFVDCVDGEIEDEIEVGTGLWGMTSYEDRVYVGITNFDQQSFTYGQGQVAVIDMNNRALIDTIEVGINPGILFIDHQGELNVVCIGDYFSVFSEVYRINPTDNTIIASFELGGSPSYATLLEDGKVYLGAGGWDTEGYVLVYDSNSETVIHGGDDPIVIEGETGVQQIAVDLEGNLYACCFNSDHIVKMDTTGNVLKVFAVGDGPQTLVYVAP